MKQLAFRFSADLLPGEEILDLFAGGGGASKGIEAATGRSPNHAVNHDKAAIAMHMANHPGTKHHHGDIWATRFRRLTEGRPVGLAWFSPDCRHFSRAKGGKPVSKRVRSLAWVVVAAARQVRPRVIMLENVPEFLTWGPVGKDNLPIKARAGETFNRWAGQLRKLGYEVQWKILNAADYGAPTSRKRIFLVARCDGRAIRWPEPTHGPGRALPWRTAAECIDWSIPCPSIFDRSKPLAEATMARIARGIKRYVLDSAKPFIVNLTHGGRVEDLGEPMRTVTGAHRGEKAVVSPILAGCGGRAGQSEPRPADGQMYTITGKADTCLVAPTLARIGQTGGNGKYCNAPGEPLTTITTKGEHCLVAPTLVQTSYGERKGQAPRTLDLHKPLGTVVAGGQKHAVVSAFLAKHYGGVTGQPLDKPAGTITTQDHHAPVAVHLTKFRTNSTGSDPQQPLDTITGGGGGAGGHFGLVAAHLTMLNQNSTGQDPRDPLHTVMAGASRFGMVYAFLAKYYGTAVGQVLSAPLDTVTSKDRFGVVTVSIDGQEYAIADIGMRMLQPRELAKAQGFPDDYILTGTKSEQVAKIGNSVCPPVAEAMVRANLVAEPAAPYEAVA